MEKRDTLVEYLNRTLQAHGIEDYCPNGLQVAGREEISHLVSGVTASLQFLELAIEAGADAVLVHHGYFWRGESPVLTGMKLARIRLLIENDISLLAYHLPLDVHPRFGNNARLGQRLGLIAEGQHAAGGTDGLFWYGHLPKALSPQAFSEQISESLSREVTLVGDLSREIKRVGWCSGGAQRFVTQAAELGLDAFISGEISEQTTHEARENGLVYIAAGHHATERYGVQSVGEYLSGELQLTHQFIDVDNPA